MKLDEPGPAGLFTRLTRVGLLLDAFQHRCLDAFGLRFIDYALLRVLQGADDRVSAGELSGILLRSTGGVTQILDRLERRGLVERATDPSDRRKVLVGLTDPGLRLAKEAGAAYEAERDELLSSLPAGEVRRLDAAVRRLLDALSG